MAEDKKYHKVGRRHWEWRLKPEESGDWRRPRLPFTKRHLLKWHGVHNEKTLQRERVLVDKKPLWWLLGLSLFALIVPFLPNSMISVASIFCVYASINILWTLIVGTAGIFSLATLAVVGAAGYFAAAANVYLGVPWPFMLLIGPFIGLVFGAILAVPSTRLDGLYYALLTMGVAEICRVFVSQLRALTPTSGAITQVDSFIPDAWFFTAAGAFARVRWCFRLASRRTVGLEISKLRTARAVAQSCKDIKRRRGLCRSSWYRFSSSAIGGLYHLVSSTWGGRGILRHVLQVNFAHDLLS